MNKLAETKAAVTTARRAVAVAVDTVLLPAFGEIGALEARAHHNQDAADKISARDNYNADYAAKLRGEASNMLAAAALLREAVGYDAEAARLEAVLAEAVFEAHGSAHTIASARARIAHLEEINAGPVGPSDGRVTEINTLREALENTCLCETQSGVCGHCVNVALAEEERREATARVEARHAADKAANSSITRLDVEDPEAAKFAAHIAEQVRKSRAELAGMERGTPGTGRIEYLDIKSGKRRVARYETRDGFLRGYIRMATNRNAYDMLHVDEN